MNDSIIAFNRAQKLTRCLCRQCEHPWSEAHDPESVAFEQSRRSYIKPREGAPKAILCPSCKSSFVHLRIS